MSITLLSVIHFGALDNQIIQELFRVAKARNPQTAPITTEPMSEITERDNPEMAGKREEDLVDSLEKTSSFRQVIQFTCPTKFQCFCLKMNRKERIMARCRANYYSEINIVEHIMQFREMRHDVE